ncbi:hypothetical protein V8F20_000586 [Naviculisporaceae sp. PSN 640]
MCPWKFPFLGLHDSGTDSGNTGHGPATAGMALDPFFLRCLAAADGTSSCLTSREAGTAGTVCISERGISNDGSTCLMCTCFLVQCCGVMIPQRPVPNRWRVATRPTTKLDDIENGNMEGKGVKLGCDLYDFSGSFDILVDGRRRAVSAYCAIRQRSRNFSRSHVERIRIYWACWVGAGITTECRERCSEEELNEAGEPEFAKKRKEAKVLPSTLWEIHSSPSTKITYTPCKLHQPDETVRYPVRWTVDDVRLGSVSLASPQQANRQPDLLRAAKLGRTLATWKKTMA